MPSVVRFSKRVFPRPAWIRSGHDRSRPRRLAVGAVGIGLFASVVLPVGVLAARAGQQAGGATSVPQAPIASAAATLSPVVDIAAGYGHTCAVLEGGSAQCWGSNSAGRLGNGSTFDWPSPVPVANLSQASAVAAGIHSCALRSDGTVRCWGFNGAGEIGDGTLVTRLTPVAVPGLSGVTSIGIGQHDTCAVLADTTVRCWGFNGLGQLGDGTTATRLSPVAVPGLTGVTAISVGGYHTCAVLTDTTVRCWGENSGGQLGDGTTTNRASPVPVSGLTGVVAVAAGENAGDAHTCAVLADTTVACWGHNFFGQVGDGTTTDRLSPVAVPGLTGAIAITAGADFTCALLSDGSIRCWGDNASGQLGDGTTIGRTSPVQVSGVTEATAVDAGLEHACAIVVDATMRCWGSNRLGQLGDGTKVNASTPVTLTVLPFGTATRVQVDDSGCCPLDHSDGGVGRVKTAHLGYVIPYAYSYARGQMTAEALSAGSNSEANSGARTRGRALAFRTFLNTTAASQTFRVNAVLSGRFDHAFLFSDLTARGSVYALDTTAFTAALDAGTVTPASLLDGDDLSVPTLLASSILTSAGVEAQGPDNTPIVAPIATDLITVPSGHVFTVLFEVRTTAVSRTAAEFKGTGYSSFLDTLAPAPTFFTDVSGAAVTGFVALGPSPIAEPAPAALALAPSTSTGASGGSHTVTATLTDSAGAPVQDLPVSFEITSGPDAGAAGVALSDAAGQASYTYTDGGGSGTDAIVAFVGAIRSNTVERTWTGSLTMTAAPGGSCASGGAAGTIRISLAAGATPSSGILSVTSTSNATLLPTANVMLGGVGANRTVTLTPVAKRSGSAVITLALTDGGSTTTLPITVVVGSDKNDALNGTAGADLILGLGGKNTLLGAGGNDLLCGGNGLDAMDGGGGDDTLDGQNGDDALTGGEGDDILRGGSGDDRLEGGGGQDILTGASGSDFFSGGPGTDTLTDVTASQRDRTDGS